MTYSIIGRDRESGEVGVATQSQALAVGSSVPFAIPAVGVIATQSMAEPMYGQVGLDLLRGGFTAQEALTALRSVDPHPERRQIAITAVSGDAAVYTGNGCVQAAGDAVGEDCVVLANLVTSERVWTAMAESFTGTTGPLTQRLLTALHAAEDAGGDLRGRRSAAVIVVRSEATGRPWRDTVADLRVDDSPHPLDDLDALLAKRARYQEVVRSFELALDGDAVTADQRLQAMRPQDPYSEPDQALWRAVVAALAGREDDARRMLTELDATAPEFVEAARRFAPAGLLPGEVLERILPPG